MLIGCCEDHQVVHHKNEVIFHCDLHTVASPKLVHRHQWSAPLRDRAAPCCGGQWYALTLFFNTCKIGATIGALLGSRSGLIVKFDLKFLYAVVQAELEEKDIPYDRVAEVARPAARRLAGRALALAQPPGELGAVLGDGGAVGREANIP